jgi:hypothetical protein
VPRIFFARPPRRADGGGNHSGAIYGPAILIPTAILSEIDYLIVAKLGLGAELDLLDDILGGAFTLEPVLPQTCAVRES